MRKKLSLTGSILTIIGSLSGIIFEILKFILFLLTYNLITETNESSSGAEPVLLLNILSILFIIVAIVNIILCCFSCYASTNEERYKNKSKLILVNIVITFIEAILLSSTLFLGGTSSIIIVPILLIIVLLIANILMLIDYIKYKKNLNTENN